MSVQKIFMTLIIVVACVILGAFVLNALLPNVIAGMSNSAESMLKNATGMSFDVNGDGQVGTTGGKDANKGINSKSSDTQTNGNNVNGYGDGDATRQGTQKKE